METMATVSAIIKTILDGTDSIEEVMAVFMTALDEWAMTHNVSPAELEDIVTASAEIMKDCHEQMGW